MCRPPAVPPWIPLGPPRPPLQPPPRGPARPAQPTAVTHGGSRPVPQEGPAACGEPPGPPGGSPLPPTARWPRRRRRRRRRHSTGRRGAPPGPWGGGDTGPQGGLGSLPGSRRLHATPVPTRRARWLQQAVASGSGRGAAGPGHTALRAAPPASTSSWPSKGAGTLPVAFAVPRPCQGGAGLAAVLRGRGRWFAARGAGVPHAAPGCHERPGLPRSSSSAPQLPAPPRPHGPGAAQGRRAVCAHGGKGERGRGACRGPGRGRCHREERAGRPGSCPLGRGHTRPLAARPFLWLPLSPLSSQLPWADPSAGKARPSPQLRETVLGEGLGQSRVPSELEMHQAPEPGRGQRGQLVLCQVPRTADSQGHWRTTGLRGAGPREARGP